jgi:hypothetical protein
MKSKVTQKKNLSPAAIRLLRRVQKRILKEPKQFEMSTGFILNGHNAGILFSSTPDYIRHGEIPNCGTAACVAGWALTLGTGCKKPIQAARKFHEFRKLKSVWGPIESRARRILSLSKEQSNRLFYADQWPVQFNRDRSLTGFSRLSKRKQAQLAVKRIDHFIKTDGAE